MTRPTKGSRTTPAPAPKYVVRLARLPRVLELLAAHPEGLRLSQLAEEVGVPPEELREDLLAFYTADVGPEWLMGLSRPDILEFLPEDRGEDEESEDDEDDDDYGVDPTEAAVVRITDPRPTQELGVEYVDASELALIYTAGQALLDIEPDNDDLRAALAALAETLVGDPESTTPPAAAPWTRALPTLQDAVRDRRRVRIVYSRAWAMGVGERVIEPYRLSQTRRGWEVDAGPLDADGRMRTFLLSNIREVTPIEETFEPPDDLPARLQDQRATTTVRVRIPHETRWAADVYAEQVRVVEGDEGGVVLDLDLLPPVDRRVGLLVLASAGRGEVLEPTSLRQAGAELAAELLRHLRS